jgi:hypothetical protein
MKDILNFFIGFLDKTIFIGRDVLRYEECIRDFADVGERTRIGTAF